MVKPLTPAEIQSINTALAELPKGKLRYRRTQREEFFRLRGTDLSDEDIAALKEQFESDETGIDASQRDETALLQDIKVEFRSFLKKLSEGNSMYFRPSHPFLIKPLAWFRIITACFPGNRVLAASKDSSIMLLILTCST